MNHDYHGRVALVTGAANGLGMQTVRRFAEAGAAVVIADIDAERGGALAREITAGGTQALFCRTDVSNADDVAALIAATKERFGRLDYAFNNAGIAPLGRPISEFDMDDWNRVIAVNLTGVFCCMKHEVPLMLASGGGAIVNTASSMGLVSGPGLAGYSASKSGVIGLTRAAAIDYAAQGITVNAICPGGIGGTEITAAPENARHMEQLRLMTPMQRLGVTDDIAAMVLYLCSPGATYMTGQAIAIDGGYTAV